MGESHTKRATTLEFLVYYFGTLTDDGGKQCDGTRLLQMARLLNHDLGGEAVRGQVYRMSAARVEWLEQGESCGSGCLY